MSVDTDGAQWEAVAVHGAGDILDFLLNVSTNLPMSNFETNKDTGDGDM